MSEMKPPRVAKYRPDVFDAADLDSAKRIILTDEPGATTEERWQRETEYLVPELGRALELDADDCVLDYGCGIGRLARGLIERYGCSVVGVDVSARMRHLAAEYVGSERFIACSPAMLEVMVAQGFRASEAYVCWVLQHCVRPGEDIARIDAALETGGRLFALNSIHRCVPSDLGWADDGVSVERLLTGRFALIARGALPVEATTREIAESTYTMVLGKRG